MKACLEKVIRNKSTKIDVRIWKDYIVLQNKDGETIYLVMDSLMHSQEERSSINFTKFFGEQ